AAAGLEGEGVGAGAADQVLDVAEPVGVGVAGAAVVNARDETGVGRGGLVEAAVEDELVACIVAEDGIVAHAAVDEAREQTCTGESEVVVACAALQVLDVAEAGGEDDGYRALVGALDRPGIAIVVAYDRVAEGALVPTVDHAGQPARGDEDEEVVVAAAGQVLDVREPSWAEQGPAEGLAQVAGVGAQDEEGVAGVVADDRVAVSPGAAAV